MTQYIFRNQVNQWKDVGVDFVHYPYFPEFDERIGEFFHEREDHGHLLKRLQIASERVICLTLTGKRKQSIPDCERVFSLGVLNYMADKGHESEYQFVNLVQNWLKAVDGWGLDENLRSQHCQKMLKWLLVDLMPWTENVPVDFRTLHVSRKIQTDRVRGLTRETVVGLLDN